MKKLKITTGQVLSGLQRAVNENFSSLFKLKNIHLVHFADKMRAKLKGDLVTYGVVRNINYTSKTQPLLILSSSIWALLNSLLSSLWPLSHNTNILSISSFSFYLLLGSILFQYLSRKDLTEDICHSSGIPVIGWRIYCLEVRIQVIFHNKTISLMLFTEL